MSEILGSGQRRALLRQERLDTLAKRAGCALAMAFLMLCVAAFGAVVVTLWRWALGS